MTLLVTGNICQCGLDLVVGDREVALARISEELLRKKDPIAPAEPDACSALIDQDDEMEGRLQVEAQVIDPFQEANHRGIGGVSYEN